MKVNFILDSPLLKQVGINMNWNFPCLPRVGEMILPDIFLRQTDIESCYCKYISEQGEEDLKDFLSKKKDKIDSKLLIWMWLYEVICEINIVREIKYMVDDEDNNQIRAVIVLSDKE